MVVDEFSALLASITCYKRFKCFRLGKIQHSQISRNLSILSVVCSSNYILNVLINGESISEDKSRELASPLPEHLRE